MTEKETPLLDLAALELDRAVCALLPATTCRKIEGMCVAREGQALVVAAVDPTELHVFDMVQMATGGRYQVRLVRGDPRLLELAHEFVFRTPEALHHEPWSDWLRKKTLDSVPLDVRRAEPADPEEAAERLTGLAVERAEKVIREALALGASDIHLEAYAEALTIRYRVDGVLQLSGVVEERREALALLKRIKVMANIDVAQDRVTQGGRITMSLGDTEFDMRVSVVPTAFGEHIVLRILGRGSQKVDLADLGLEPRQLEQFRQAIQYPYGLVLVSGPTGSGKSTTLYASIGQLARPDRKILTVEDPVEFSMPGLTQVQVNLAAREPERRVTFASALREFLRQDPDVIMVGEIRDAETAQISIQAALTGHLVLSTIHTNDAVGIINRLKDQGLQPFLIASTLTCGVAQRLARRLCLHCSRPDQPTPRERELFRRHDQEVDELRRAGPGCEKCRRTGYAGRTGLYEVMVVDDQLRRLIEREATAPDMEEAARAAGMRSLLQDGLAKAARGLVDMAEVARVTRLDL